MVFVVLDDTGYADLGCFGSEIATPTMDRLAAGGLRYTNFHTTPLCSPTRAALLTGRNHHRVGMRFLAALDTGFPNSRGRVSRNAGMLQEVLRQQGYATLAVGKWHLALSSDTGPAGPYADWPLGRGFERFYGFLEGVTDHHTPDLVIDNQCVDPPTRPDYHLTEDLVDQAIRLVDEQRQTARPRPFFLYLGFGATHAPFWAPKEYVDKYVPIFEKGWDRTREDRLARQKALGVVPQSTELTPPNEGVRAWDALGAGEQQFYVRLQAAYAGFLEHCDEHLGRLVRHLEETGDMENTIFVLLSDNGASGEGSHEGSFDVYTSYNAVAEDLAENLARLDEIGGPLSAPHYPTGWAMASNTPFRRYKRFVDGGGVNTPLIMYGPRRIQARGEVRPQFVHAVDVAPTVLDLLGTTFPETLNGLAQLPVDGKSFADTFDDVSAAPPRDTQYFEMFGHRGIWHDGWKAVAVHEKGTDYADDQWRLYHVAEDFSECQDLAAEEPSKRAEMIERWWSEARQHNVLPLDDRTMNDLLTAIPHDAADDHPYVYRPGQYVPAVVMPKLGDRSFAVSAEVDRQSAETEGVLLASGGRRGGFAFFVLGDRLVFDYNDFGKSTLVMSESELPPGRVTLGLRFQRTGYCAGDVTLLVNGSPVGSGHLPRVHHFPSTVGMEVGRNSRSAVSSLYANRGDFAFPTNRLRQLSLVVGAAAEPDPTAERVALGEQ